MNESIKYFHDRVEGPSGKLLSKAHNPKTKEQRIRYAQAKWGNMKLSELVGLVYDSYNVSSEYRKYPKEFMGMVITKAEAEKNKKNNSFTECLDWMVELLLFELDKTNSCVFQNHPKHALDVGVVIYVELNKEESSFINKTVSSMVTYHEYLENIMLRASDDLKSEDEDINDVFFNITEYEINHFDTALSYLRDTRKQFKEKQDPGPVSIIKYWMYECRIYMLSSYKKYIIKCNNN